MFGIWRKILTGKINCNGVSKGNPSPAGASVLIRDPRGHMILGFTNLHEHTNTFAEIYAVVKGLRYVHELGYFPITMEIDALAVLHIINEDWGNWQLQLLLTQLRQPRCMDVQFTHIFREANQPAHHLANMAFHIQTLGTMATTSGRLATLIRFDNIMPNFRF
ncbi:UNVERIFIED_CONTAM: hypothetical protein Slati_3129300 [Sesamum latifolium]|uniref:RNase H type-1 domain-containing protein n=1 Tax=Sesamum latifolium TaxID=2727402 RepID=A0AAW2UWD4_9LAMI